MYMYMYMYTVHVCVCVKSKYINNIYYDFFRGATKVIAISPLNQITH